MKKYFIVYLSLLLIPIYTLAQQEATTKKGKKVILYENGTWKYADKEAKINAETPGMEQLELPKFSEEDDVVHHKGFSLCYNEAHEQSKWVAYELTDQKTVKIFKRTDKFLIDPMIKTGSATNEDYKGSGYDRGHLAPAADMGWSDTAMKESFYFSNMSPQVPSFNRGIWKKLEELVRDWAIAYKKIYVATGPVLTKGLPTIGPNEVSVPSYFYKVILEQHDGETKAIGFIIPNEASSSSLQDYAVSIDHVEEVTGIDFYYQLEDAQEKEVEKKLCIKCWEWKKN